MALVVLSKVEQRLDAVRAVLAGASVTEVAAGVGVSRVTLHEWLRRYLVHGSSRGLSKAERLHVAGPFAQTRLQSLRLR